MKSDAQGIEESCALLSNPKFLAVDVRCPQRQRRVVEPEVFQGH